MNELLQKHGCSNVFTVPDGLRELMADISREVLREQPSKINDFIANYLSALLVTREHGVMAMKILEDLCDCRATVSEHLMQLGFPKKEADAFSGIIKTEVEGFEPTHGKEKVRETEMLQKILKVRPLDEPMMMKVCQVARNAYRDYWYRKKIMEKGLKMQPDEPWEMAAQHTLELYKQTRPSFTELTRATQKIQAAYRGYYTRKSMLKHMTRQPKKQGPTVALSGPPADTAASREIDLGPVIDIKAKVRDDNVKTMFEEQVGESLGLRYNPMKTITHVSENTDAKKQDFPFGKETNIYAMQTKPVKAVRINLTEAKSLPEELGDTIIDDAKPQIMSAITVTETASAPDKFTAEAKAAAEDFGTKSQTPPTIEVVQEVLLEVLQGPPVVSEDITDDRMDLESVSTACISSSAPVSTDVSDDEDGGDE